MRKFMRDHIAIIVTLALAFAGVLAKAALADVNSRIDVLRSDVDDHEKHLDKMSAQIEWLYTHSGGPVVPASSNPDKK